mmetsp:Transcript_11317/g.12795  ORF Transcript_11317/g.12795 Transcript_11317/m.12795 type:complete len:107 (+) Transcript_11317:91-411(+)
MSPLSFINNTIDESEKSTKTIGEQTSKLKEILIEQNRYGNLSTLSKSGKGQKFSELKELKDKQINEICKGLTQYGYLKNLDSFALQEKYNTFLKNKNKELKRLKFY